MFPVCKIWLSANNNSLLYLIILTLFPIHTKRCSPTRSVLLHCYHLTISYTNRETASDHTKGKNCNLKDFSKINVI